MNEKQRMNEYRFIVAIVQTHSQWLVIVANNKENER